MNEKYVLNNEYPTYFSNLNALRHRIASNLPIKSDMCILDLATGYGYFAIEIAKRENRIKITGIDISQNDIQKARKNVVAQDLADRIKIIKMDATKMGFTSGSFDMVINFLGLEDIHMTRGKDGIYETFLEVNRVLKSGGCFCFVVMPPEEMATKAQKIEVAIFSYICDATWLSAREYEKMLKRTGFILIRKKKYYTGRKLTSLQAKEEIKFACDNAPKIYGVKTPPFEKVWEKFGKDIKKYGLGHYSKVVLFIAQKVINSVDNEIKMAKIGEEIC